MNRLESVTKPLRWFMALLLVVSIGGCLGSGGKDPILGGIGSVVAPAPTAPKVTAVAPLAKATGVPINTKIVTAAFTKAMDPTTLTPASFTLACGAPVTGAVTYVAAGNVATLTLPAATILPASTVCTATVTSGAKDTSGIPLASNFVWTFTTGATPDVIAPTVSSTVPLPNAVGVAFNTLVTANFSEPMDPLTITTANFTLACPAGIAITGTVGYAVNGNVATFKPASNLPASTTCTATISTGVKDVAGNAMASPFTWTFTTGAAPDVIAPTVSSTVPRINATAVAFNTLVTASFSEPMDPLTITTANFTLACPAATAITGTVGYAAIGNVATFRPASNLPASTTCTATISTGVKDVAGNAMVSPFTWSFTTGAVPDVVAPTVISTVPLATATGVPLNTLVTANFSEPMDPLTITPPATFTLACPVGTAIAGTVGYAANGNVATLKPASSLPASTICRATITTAVKDVAGNAMVIPFTWSFTTGPVPDTTAPTVTWTYPRANATDMAINTLIAATFSEEMDPLTITTATFTVGGVTGTVTYDAIRRTADFALSSNLQPGRQYTASITSGATDLAGNALVSGLVPNPWVFNTAAAIVIPAGPGPAGAAPDLGAAAPFGFLSSAALTSEGDDPNSRIIGNAGTTGVAAGVRGLHDATPTSYTETCPTLGAAVGCGLVTGTIFASNAPIAEAPPGATAIAAAAAALNAYSGPTGISPASRPGGLDVTTNSQAVVGAPTADELGGRTLAPGIYYSAAGPGAPASYKITAGDLTLDAGGNANAVWVFQMDSSLTVSFPTGPLLTVPRSVNLIGNAQAKNVFWYVPAGAVINTGSHMVGTIISNASTTFGTSDIRVVPPAGAITTLEGRALVLGAGATMVNTVITVPGP